jgi:hypothetical protein
LSVRGAILKLRDERLSVRGAILKLKDEPLGGPASGHEAQGRALERAGSDHEP